MLVHCLPITINIYGEEKNCVIAGDLFFFQIDKNLMSIQVKWANLSRYFWVSIICEVDQVEME